MNIVMMTNTYLPHLGGVAHSVQAFSEDLRRLGHKVLIIAPHFANEAPSPAHVIRLKAWQGFNGSPFSVINLFQPQLKKTLLAFQPQLIHSHHPFLMGQLALQLANHFNLPLVFTHHTRYDHYTHYLPFNSPWLQAFARALACHYANCCSALIAPSHSLAQGLQPHIQVPIHIIPTGVDLNGFQCGSGEGLRQCLGIPQQAFVVGHIGRLTGEKNLLFLAESLSRFLQQTPSAFALIAGEGPMAAALHQQFKQAGVLAQVKVLGALSGPLLVSAYKAMDVFAFSSLSETQGLVIAEALAAGVPVVALQCPVLQEVISQGRNGFLVHPAHWEGFCAALRQCHEWSLPQKRQQHHAAIQQAEHFQQQPFSRATAALYEQLQQHHTHQPRAHHSYWPCLLKAAWQAFRRAKSP